MKKFISLFLVFVMAFSVLGTGVLGSRNNKVAYADENLVYIDDGYSEYKKIAPTRERGRCTDVYSKSWCNAHGYKNNRPVGKVTMSAKERECAYRILALFGKGACVGLGFMTVNGKMLVKISADVSYMLYTCKGVLNQH